MTQIQTMTNPELNRALAELMGYTVKKLPIGANGRQLYALVTPTGKERLPAHTIDNAYLDAPDYAGDPAASLEVQVAAIARHKGQYFHHLLTIKNTDLQASPMVAYVAIALASPRERAEAAYITLSQVHKDGS